jgi:hypothetical protein
MSMDLPASAPGFSAVKQWRGLLLLPSILLRGVALLYILFL